MLAPAAVCKEKDLLRIPADTMPIEQCAVLREIFTAYRLLEDHASLKVGQPGSEVIFPRERSCWRNPSALPACCSLVSPLSNSQLR